MKRLNKMHYYTRTGEKKLNCYYIHIPKEIVEKAKLEEEQVEIREENGKIIIEKK